MKKEIWKDIPGYEGHYQVSSLGNVRSLDRLVKDLNRNRVRKFKGVTLKKANSKTGYMCVGVLKSGKQIHLGTFKDEYEAHLEYQKKLKEITND